MIWVTGSSIGNIYDLDFDASGNLWAGGNNPAIYRIKQDKSVKQFPFTCNARSIRVYDGYLYVGGKVDTTEGVWRAQIINSDSLGAFEKYFDFSATILRLCRQCGDVCRRWGHVYRHGCAGGTHRGASEQGLRSRCIPGCSLPRRSCSPGGMRTICI